MAILLSTRTLAVSLAVVSAVSGFLLVRRDQTKMLRLAQPPQASHAGAEPARAGRVRRVLKDNFARSPELPLPERAEFEEIRSALANAHAALSDSQAERLTQVLASEAAKPDGWEAPPLPDGDVPLSPELFRQAANFLRPDQMEALKQINEGVEIERQVTDVLGGPHPDGSPQGG